MQAVHDSPLISPFFFFNNNSREAFMEKGVTKNGDADSVVISVLLR